MNWKKEYYSSLQARIRIIIPKSVIRLRNFNIRWSWILTWPRRDLTIIWMLKTESLSQSWDICLSPEMRSLQPRWAQVTEAVKRKIEEVIMQVRRHIHSLCLHLSNCAPPGPYTPQPTRKTHKRCMSSSESHNISRTRRNSIPCNTNISNNKKPSDNSKYMKVKTCNW